MNSHFFTAPFYFAFIWFRVLVAASPPFLMGAGEIGAFRP